MIWLVAVLVAASLAIIAVAGFIVWFSIQLRREVKSAILYKD